MKRYIIMPAHPMRNSFSKRRQTCQTFFDVKGLLAIEIHLKIQKVLKEFARSSSLFENGPQSLNVTKPNNYRKRSVWSRSIPQALYQRSVIYDPLRAPIGNSWISSDCR